MGVSHLPLHGTCLSINTQSLNSREGLLFCCLGCMGWGWMMAERLSPATTFFSLLAAPQQCRLHLEILNMLICQLIQMMPAPRGPGARKGSAATRLWYRTALSIRVYDRANPMVFGGTSGGKRGNMKLKARSSGRITKYRTWDFKERYFSSQQVISCLLRNSSWPVTRPW